MNARLAFCLAVGLAGCDDSRASASQTAEPKAAVAPEARDRTTYLRTEHPRPRLGRCQASACTWLEARDQQTVGSSEHERLVRIALASGTSSHPDGEFPTEAASAPVAWSGATEQVYVFCSPWRPSVMRRLSDGGWQEVRVDLVPGAQLPVYGLICHPAQDWSAPGFFERAGYRPQPGQPTRRRGDPVATTFIYPHDPQRPEQGGIAVSSSSPPPVVAVGLEPPPIPAIDARPAPDRSDPVELIELDAQGEILGYLRTYSSLSACEQARSTRSDLQGRNTICSLGLRSVQ